MHRRERQQRRARRRRLEGQDGIVRMVATDGTKPI
jgi:hypothetical protein